MKVLWTPRAAADLDSAVEYISKDKPDAAIRVAERIYQQVMTLESTPQVGRPGRVPGTRELVFAPWQWIAVYRIDGEAVRVLRIRHTSRKPGVR